VATVVNYWPVWSFRSPSDIAVAAVVVNVKSLFPLSYQKSAVWEHLGTGCAI
jgi:hypothetical protein